MVKIDEQKIDEILSRGVEEVIDRSHLEAKLKSGKQLRVKLGIDPTSPNLHLGRAIPLLKLRDFQNLGHKIVLIIGDFTGVIGDTSDKESERPMLDRKTIERNMKTYAKQAGKIIDIKKCEIRRNSEWLKKLNYWQIGEQADNFSLSEFIARENIKKRLEAETRVSLRELLYPLMQGYDSVAVKADVELGGTDQRFNLLAGRELQEFYKQERQDIVINPLIEGLDGRKMSSSWGNTVNLFDQPNEMFGKIMSLRDEYIKKYFTLLTRLPILEIEQITTGNPRDAKARLGFEIVKIFHGEKEAKKAQEEFDKVFKNREMPSEMPEFIFELPKDIVYILVNSKIASSKNDAWRLVNQGAVKFNSKIIKNPHEQITEEGVLKVGSRRFIKIRT